MNNIYFSTNGKVDNNILLVDSNKIDLNTEFWNFFLENHKNYNTTIFIVTDKINKINIKNIKKYVNNTYIVKYITEDLKNIYKIYKTFFKDNIEDLEFDKIICNECDLDVICINKYLNNIKIYKGIINVNILYYNFNTYKIYDEFKLFKERCTLRDIINI
jgi:hypothetical protein